MIDILNINSIRSDQPLGVVGGVPPFRIEKEKPLCEWQIEKGADRNYRLLGRLLAGTGGLYRGHEDQTGLILLRPNGKIRRIHRGKELISVVVDRIQMQVMKDGKVTRELPTQFHFEIMLHTNEFLENFTPVDEVTKRPVYLNDFTLAKPGYNNGDPGDRILFVGDPITPANSTETIDTFLDVMDFSTNSDRTNTVAAALTSLLLRKWHGGKPAIIVTATKSHAGKGTVTDFIRGSVAKADILYESIDWAMQSQFQKLLRINPEIGMLIFDNVRLDSAGGRGKIIRSGFIESFVTNEETILACPTGGNPICEPNRFLIAINTNDGKLSPDLMNRALPIHLKPKGDIRDRNPSIGNPKLDFLPKNREQIELELHGMIDRWKQVGQPLDGSVKHPMSPWARTIGGILKVNGYTDFLANYQTRRTVDDPIKDSLSILGAAKPGEGLRPGDWAKLVVNEGLAKTLFASNERDTHKGRERAIGVILSHHLNDTFEASSDTTRYRLKLEGGNRRWKKGELPHKRYVFTVLETKSIPLDN